MSFGCLEYSGGLLQSSVMFYHIMAGVNSLSSLFPVVPFISCAHKGFFAMFGCVTQGFVISSKK